MSIFSKKKTLLKYDFSLYSRMFNSVKYVANRNYQTKEPFIEIFFFYDETKDNYNCH
jgi:hypothetical protein